MNWINPGILAGFAALAIPIIIHFLRNLRYQQANLGSLRFLRLALKQSQRKRRLRELLLLLARLIMVALLVMLFARPFLEDPNNKKGEREYIFLIDASGSMAGERADKQSFDHVKIDAIKRLEELPDTAKTTIAFFSDEVKEVKDKEGIKNFKLKPAGVADYTKALKWAYQKMKESDRPKRRVLMFTDYQKAGVPKVSDNEELVAEDGKKTELVTNPPKDVLVEIHPVPMADITNYAIIGVHNGAPHAGTAGPLTIDIRCYGKLPRLGKKIKVIAEVDLPDSDKPKLYQKVVDVDRRMSVTFLWKPKERGIFTGKVWIVDAAGEKLDKYPRDNSREFALVAGISRPVLLVNGVKGNSRFDDETYFLQKALEVQPNKDLPPNFYTEVKDNLNGLSYLSKYQAIALCNTKSISKGQAAMLRDYVKDGGGLIYFLGNQTSKSNCDRLARMGIFPAEYVSLEGYGISQKLNQWSKSHPAFKMFRDPRKGNLRRILFQQGFTIEADDDKDVLATLSNEAHAIIGKKVGNGYVMIVANSVRARWTTENIFVPFVHEMFKFLSKNKRVELEVKEKPQGMNEQRDFGITKNQEFVIVPNAKESNIDIYSSPEFRSKLRLGADPGREDLSGNDKLIPEGAHRDDEIWLYLILGVLAIAAIENLLADRGQA